MRRVISFVLLGVLAFSCTRAERRMEKDLPIGSAEPTVELSPRGLGSLKVLLQLYAPPSGMSQAELNLFFSKFLPPLAENREDFFDDGFLSKSRVSPEDVLRSLRENNVVIRLASAFHVFDLESLLAALRKELNNSTTAARFGELERMIRLVSRHFLARDPDFKRAALSIGKILANIERELNAGTERTRLLESIVRRIHFLSADEDETAALTMTTGLELDRSRVVVSWYTFAFQYFLLLEGLKNVKDSAGTLSIMGLEDRVELFKDPDNPGKELAIDREDRLSGAETRTWDPLDATDFLSLRGARVVHRWLFESLPQGEAVDVQASLALEELSWWTAIRYLYRLPVMSAPARDALIANAFPSVGTKLGARNSKAACCRETPERAAEFGAEWVSMLEFDSLTSLCGPTPAEFEDRARFLERVAVFNKKIVDEKKSGRDSLCAAWGNI